jgi:hypothetical protein
VISTLWHIFSPENAGKSHNAEMANSLTSWGICPMQAYDEVISSNIKIKAGRFKQFISINNFEDRPFHLCED